ncbi:hypothetical protein ABZ611_31845 [Streptomyces sp. NPDC007861]|uniref:hypothetical protein n=1 Tax=Streptomyces sp. NPDC007861 TaxID=3154893 RepID=UPI0033CD4F8D
MTPEEMLDVHLHSLAHGIQLLGGSRDDFLARPCRVIQMPRTEYRKRFRRLSEEEQKRLRDQVQEHLLEDPGEYHRRLYPETEQYWAWVNSLPLTQNRASHALQPLIREAMARGHNPYTDGPELDRHTQDVREGYGDAVPEFEE